MTVTPDPTLHVKFASIVLDAWKASANHARAEKGDTESKKGTGCADSRTDLVALISSIKTRKEELF